MKRAVAIAAMAMILSAGWSFAGPESQTHDGFFLRFLPGFGWAQSVESDVLGDDFTMTGAAGLFNFQLGFAPIRNFVVFGELGNHVMVDPAVEWGGLTGSTVDTTFAVFNVGIGISFYFMPSNTYLSITGTSSQGTLEVGGLAVDTKPGWGGNVAIGKEWWAGSRGNWGLGIAVVGHYSVVEAEEIDGYHDMTNLFVGVAFSATLN